MPTSADPVTIMLWVRAGEDDPADFIYRAVSRDGAAPVCSSPTASREPKSSWTVTASRALSLPPCDAMSGPAADGVLYSLSA